MSDTFGPWRVGLDEITKEREAEIRQHMNADYDYGDAERLSGEGQELLAEIDRLRASKAAPSFPPGLDASALEAAAGLFESAHLKKSASSFRAWAAYLRAAPSNPQVRPEQANAQQSGAADKTGEGEL